VLSAKIPIGRFHRPIVIRCTRPYSRLWKRTEDETTAVETASSFIIMMRDNAIVWDICMDIDVASALEHWTPHVKSILKRICDPQTWLLKEWFRVFRDTCPYFERDNVSQDGKFASLSLKRVNKSSSSRTLQVPVSQISTIIAPRLHFLLFHPPTNPHIHGALKELLISPVAHLLKADIDQV